MPTHRVLYVDDVIQNLIMSTITPDIDKLSEFDSTVFYAFPNNDIETIGSFNMYKTTNDCTLSILYTPIMETKHKIPFEVKFEMKVHYNMYQAVSFEVNIFDTAPKAYPVSMFDRDKTEVPKPSKAKKFFSIHVGEQKLLISDIWYDRIGFDAVAFQDSTVSEEIFSLSFANSVLQKLGVTL